MSTLFFLQDSRSYVGNDMQFWKKGGNGYTTNVDEAEVYTLEQAQSRHNARETDIPWPVEYIRSKTRPAVDFQYVKRIEALAGTGIVLIKPQRMRREPTKCVHCGRFIKDMDRFIPCPHCDGDNRP